jgi:hypothetical protein
MNATINISNGAKSQRWTFSNAKYYKYTRSWLEKLQVVKNPKKHFGINSNILKEKRKEISHDNNRSRIETHMTTRSIDERHTKMRLRDERIATTRSRDESHVTMTYQYF